MAFLLPVKNYQVAKAETQLGLVVRIVDLGMQPNNFAASTRAALKAEGKDDSRVQDFKHTVEIAFELPDDLLEAGELKGKPLFISKEYALAFGSGTRKSGIKILLENIAGKELTGKDLASFDLESIIGKPLLLQIDHTVAKNGKTYANISNTLKVDSRRVIPALVNTPVVITASSTAAELDKLPVFLKEKVLKGRIGAHLSTVENSF